MFKSALLTVALVSACALASAEVLSNPLYSGGGDHAPSADEASSPGNLAIINNPLCSPYSAPSTDEGADSRGVTLAGDNPLFNPYCGPSTDDGTASTVVLALNNPLYRGN